MRGALSGIEEGVAAGMSDATMSGDMSELSLEALEEQARRHVRKAHGMSAVGYSV